MQGNPVRELRSGSTRIPGNQDRVVADRLRGCSAMLEKWRHIMQPASDHGSTAAGNVQTPGRLPAAARGMRDVPDERRAQYGRSALQDYPDTGWRCMLRLVSARHVVPRT